MSKGKRSYGTKASESVFETPSSENVSVFKDVPAEPTPAPQPSERDKLLERLGSATTALNKIIGLCRDIGDFPADPLRNFAYKILSTVFESCDSPRTRPANAKYQHEINAWDRYDQSPAKKRAECLCGKDV